MYPITRSIFDYPLTVHLPTALIAHLKPSVSLSPLNIVNAVN